jgi:hypothetical protein
VERAAGESFRLAPLIEDLQAFGITSWRGIGAALNARGFPCHTVTIAGTRFKLRGC